MDGATLGTAYVQVVPSTEGISNELGSAFNSAGESAGKSSGKKFGGSFSGALGSAMKVGGMAVAGVTAGVAAMGGAFAKSAGEVASYGDDIDKNSQKMGISATAYQEWDAILQHSGTSMDAMKGGMQKLAKAAEKGDDAFEQLGITQEDLKTMNQEELFAKTISGLQGMKEDTKRTALASQLLGGSSKQLGALLNTSAEDTEAMRKKVHELGGVMSDDAVKAAAKYQDSMQDMNTAINGVKTKVVSEFLPSITGVMDGIGMLFSGKSEKGIGMIQNGLSDFIKKLTDSIPKLIKAGTQILLALVKALVDNLPEIVKAGVQAIVEFAKGIGDALPKLIPAAVDAIMAIVDGLLDNIDEIADAALKIIKGLAEGLIKALPKLVEKAPTIIQKLVDALVKLIPKIAEAGVKLLTSLVKNLPNIISTIVKAVPEIVKSILSGIASSVSSIAQAGVKLLTALVSNLPKIISTIAGKIPSIITGIVNAIGDGISDIIEAGKDLIYGLGKGIVDGAKKVVEKAKQVAKDVLKAIKGFFGIASPSKVMHGVGGFLMEGLANGIDDAEGKVKGAMADLNKMILDNAPEDYMAVTAGLNSGSAYPNMNAYGADGNARVIDGVIVNVYGAQGQDVNALADAVAYRLQALVDRKAAVWA